MKKIIFVLLSFIIFYSASAVSPADFLNKVPDNFKPYCYEYYGKIDKSIVGDLQTYKVNVNKNDLVFTQFAFILPYKEYLSTSSQSKNISYKNSLDFDYSFLNDNNYKTFVDFDTLNQKEININFEKELIKGTFDFNFLFETKYYNIQYLISNDNINYSEVKKDNLNDFSFKYLKIKFNSIKNDEVREIIKISELSFISNITPYLVKSFFNDDIEVYSTFNCLDKDFSTIFKSYNDFAVDNNTKTIDLVLDNNPKYNVYSKFDIDNDWVEDSIDNCKTRYNPDQKDSNGDGIGDICSDDDNDGIIGYYDNCIYVSNRDQKDINNNGIGDVCEFDKDSDGIFDSKDNCISKSNPEQLDTDRDGIGDDCDNCEYYNPSQIDKDANGLGDVCDERIKKLELNDDDKDGILNSQDNCKLITNPKQEDGDKDGIGDSCDNCLNVVNTNQEDLDENGIGDMCEDSDNDGIIGYLDNCINIANSDQADDDNNGIGNFCEDLDKDNILFINDNCPYNYNPDQSDIDNDGIGDACDPKDDRYIESNKGFFIGLLVLITFIFGVGIFSMIKKLK